MVIVNQHPITSKIEISGPRTLLSLIDPARLALRVDLTGVGIGADANLRVSPDSFAVPRQTSRHQHYARSQLTLDVDRMVERSVPVKLAVTRGVAGGYTNSVDDYYACHGHDQGAKPRCGAA